jgi:RNA-directed DNA polymerase
VESKSRMRRESHVRFREGAGVRFPRATRRVIAFEREDDARRFLGELRERLGRFALELHPEKTRLIEFGRHAADRRRRRGLVGAPETFKFLGLLHICGR